MLGTLRVCVITEMSFLRNRFRYNNDLIHIIMANNYQQYSWFKEKKNELSSLMHESSGIINTLAMPQFASRLKQLGEKVSSDSFKIQIVGTFKNGKSTFINALLGEDILPTRVLPCTAVVNEIKYGESKSAVLHFRNPLPSKLLECIPEATLNHIKAHGMKDVPPMDIEYDKIDQYVTIPLDGDPEEISATSPYQAVELFYPSSLLKEGVEIIDSPGLNEADERTRCTLDYLEKADAIIYLFDANRACAKDEMETIEDILIPKGFNDMFFVANRIDNVPISQREDVKRYIEQKVSHFTTNEVFCISALYGVEGKINNDNTKYNDSGMGPFEERLTEFLTKEKGRIKLAQPARELNNILSKEALYKAIPNQRNQLSTSLNTLRSRYESAKPQIADLEIQKEQLNRQMLLRIERAKNDVRRAVLGQFRETANLIPAWVNEFEPKSNIGWATQSKLKRVTDEMTTYVREKLKNHFNDWNTQVLVPLIEEKGASIVESSDKDMKGIFDSIDVISAQIAGTTVQISTASGWERAAGFATLMFAGAGTGTAIMVNGFKGNGKDIFKNLAIDFGVGTGLVLLGIANPIIGIAALVGVIWRAFGSSQTQALNALKTQVSDTICKSILNEAPDKADEIISKLNDEFMKLVQDAVAAIDIQINNVKSQVESIIHDMEQGETKINERNELLNNSERKLQNICNKLNSLVFELAELN